MRANVVGSKKVFFACDINADSFLLLKNALTSICRELSLELITYENEIGQLGHGVLTKVDQLILDSLLVVADIGASNNISYGSSPTNPNVALEVGLANAYKIPILLIASKNNEEKIIANLKGQDFVYFPECVQVGDSESDKLKEKIIKIYKKSIIASPVKIYSSKSKLYLDTLGKIFSLPGDISFVSPELRSFIRPFEVRMRWLKEVRKCDDNEIEKEISQRDIRYSLWKEKLRNYKCTDIYPRNIFEWSNDTWRGLILNRREKKSYYQNAINLLEEFQNYQILIMANEERSSIKFWIKHNEHRPFVIFDGYGYVDIRKNLQLGAIIFSEDNVTKTFESEFKRLHSSCVLGKRNDVIDNFFQAMKKL